MWDCRIPYYKRQTSSPFLTSSASLWNNHKYKLGGKVVVWKEWDRFCFSLNTNTFHFCAMCQL
ncbi:hypothetical protein J4Q44_G00392860 [Coregonus suidteri]|uniref:Uncharacterized protein n=1 Tax=Coregonus suidteri TaxID=861788 RepID=A0AAN8KES6_9TELE